MRKSYSPLQVTLLWQQNASCNLPWILSERRSAAGCRSQWLRREINSAVIAASVRYFCLLLEKIETPSSWQLWPTVGSHSVRTHRLQTQPSLCVNSQGLTHRMFGSVRFSRAHMTRSYAIALSTPTTHTYTHNLLLPKQLHPRWSCWVGQTKDLIFFFSQLASLLSTVNLLCGLQTSASRI